MARTTCDTDRIAAMMEHPFAPYLGDRRPLSDETPRGEGVSSFWRKNTSFRESIELANVLRAFQKVAGHIGENIGRIEYTGMSYQGGAITIDPEQVMGDYPVPAEIFDRVLGRVVHEALHKTQWSDHLWKLLEPEMAKMIPMDHLRFQRLVATGEDIYIDRKADESVFGLYTQVAREKEMAALDGEIPCNQESLDELILFWWSGHFGFIPFRQKKRAYDPPLDALNQLAGKLMETLTLPLGVEAKCRRRAALFLDAWNIIREEIQTMSVIKKHLVWFRTIGPHGNNDRPQGKVSPRSLAPTLAREIKAHLALDSVDITPLIQAVVGLNDDTVVPMSRWDFNIFSHPIIDKRMVGRLKAIFQHYAARKTVANRGLSRGKTDQRRLYRVPINGRCFKEIERIPSLDWSVTLLIDASGSMRGAKWRMVENTVANIHKALSGYGNRLNALAYFEVNGVCMISKLLKGNTLLSIPPSGRTASGQAIIFAALMAKETKNKNKIIIHVTDGESNFGCDISYGIALCREKKIQLITLGCGTKERSIMEEQYQRTLQFVDNFQQLPHAMERLFRWTFLYGGTIPPLK